MSTLHNYLRVEIIEPAKRTAGGIELPDKAVAAPRWARVLEVGPGVPDITGRPLPVPFSPGDIIYFFSYAPVKCDLSQIEENGKVTYFVSEGDVLLRLPPDAQPTEDDIISLIQPIGNWCLIELVDPPERRTAGGLIIPSTAKDKPQFARVLKPGAGLRTFGASLTSLVNRELLESLKARLPEQHHDVIDQFAEEIESRIPYIAPLTVQEGDLVIIIQGRETKLSLSEFGVSRELHLIQEGDILKIYRRAGS